ncbi:hypothetical protein EJ066_21475 [Mesorhizobium sp. M9A.F.Ca.ET.002.03.1.2]|uniref:hypothetical protein n=1 Tax=Mesorhizobium sp. M9A.F.Ca.ET.002.03.1.2 TaxID=2493668 RepID=UPI000F756B1B|nr:hypothetical protein [Mesorhizobium sp. M9A.F.Ca.ET.002.03.1.2]AZN99485.1 hypothetical protein EJ066_21475 [Mesorhizobium sp. M9A.F.Ca.ET.002.03.1.2]
MALVRSLCWCVFAALIFLTSLSMSATADNAPPPPASSYWKSPLGYEHMALCGGGSQFMTSVTDRVCNGWQLSNATDAELPTYQAAYPNDCTSISCWFKTGKKACIAFADVQGQFNVGNFPTPYCPTGKNGVNPGTYACNWCEAGAMGCSGGNFIEGKVCAGGSDTVFSLQQIPPNHYHPYCNHDIQGPYRNREGPYKACLATQTTTHNGMVFAIDQKAQVKAINKAKHGKITSDLAGFCYPKPKASECIKKYNRSGTICIEPADLNNQSQKRDSAEVHHVVPRNDRRGCPCGKNDMKNAAVISRQLNNFFSNFDRVSKVSMCPNAKGMANLTELQWVEALDPY